MFPDDITKKINALPPILPDGAQTPTVEGWEARRAELVDILCREEYGFLPPPPESLTWEIGFEDDQFAAGKAPLRRIILTAGLAGGNSFSFPVNAVIPETGEAVPFFIYANFGSEVPDKYLPVEEIADHGFGMLSFCYKDVTSDDADFRNGLAGALGMKDNAERGKIALWAWAFLRVMDYAVSIPRLDKTRCAAAGHSRLGKTALLAGAADTRFTCVISNDSGCCGAAPEYIKNEGGERIEDIVNVFPFWFRESFGRYSANAQDMPFDQHFLLSAIAPRKLYVASAEGDLWADPRGEFISAAQAGEIWKKLGYKGLVCGDYPPKTGIAYHEGSVAYHIRKGLHYLSREDWNLYMRYMLS